VKLPQHICYLISAMRTLFATQAGLCCVLEHLNFSFERVVDSCVSLPTPVAPRFLYSSDYIWFLRKTNLGRFSSC